MKLPVMKKFWILICMIACIFGLTACGEEKALSEYEKEKVEYSEQYATQFLIPLFEMHASDQQQGYSDEFTMEEVEYYVSSQYGIDVDGYGFVSAVGSFKGARDTVGAIQSVGDAKASIKDKEIIVEVDVVGEKKNAVVEIVLTNDMFTRLKSAALNPVSSVGDLMIKAALNTVIGMGTVFIVLILISMIISCFSVIPRIQAALAAKKAAAQPAVTEQPAVVPEAEEQTDDLELVAVIAAAVAAAEGAATTDGFVVRSIIRRA